MSFVRWGEGGSDLYVYADVAGYVTCCGCWFGGGISADPADDFRTTELDDMLAHVARHRAEGHHVPRWLEDGLRDRWPDYTELPTTTADES